MTRDPYFEDVSSENLMKRDIQFADVSSENLMDIASLSYTDLQALKRFFGLATTSHSIDTIISQAINLPVNCKKALEGLLFHEGHLQFSLLYAISNLPKALKKLSVSLNLN